MKNVGTNKEENSDNFIVDLEKNFKHFSVLQCRFQISNPPFPHHVKGLQKKLQSRP